MINQYTKVRWQRSESYLTVTHLLYGDTNKIFLLIYITKIILSSEDYQQKSETEAPSMAATGPTGGKLFGFIKYFPVAQVLDLAF